MGGGGYPSSTYKVRPPILAAVTRLRPDSLHPRWRRPLAALLAATSLSACSPLITIPVPDQGPDDPDLCDGREDGEFACDEGTAVPCVGGREDRSNRRDCEAAEQVCVGGPVGCAMCRPTSRACDGNTIIECEADGSGFREVQECPETTQCSPQGCYDLCARAEDEESYQGCEYWPVTTLNTLLAREFRFAVAVANPQAIDVDIRIERGGSLVTERTLSPGALQTIELPWERALSHDNAGRSVRVAGGAYRLTSTAPVTVYQLNPLDFRIPMDCADEVGATANDGECFSFTNDASLLLPTHVLTGSYLGMARPSWGLDQGGGFSGLSGFLALIGVEDRDIEVEVVSSAFVAGSRDGSVASMNPGESQRFTLGAGDVVQLVSEVPSRCTGSTDRDSDGTYCLLGEDYDLTGSAIRVRTTGGAIGVISGHDCTFVPYNRWACDHLEEMLAPTESWGTEIVVGRSEALRGEPNVVRVLSARDGNVITFDPAVREPVSLGFGEMLELEVEGSVRLSGTESFTVAQFLVGQDYAGVGTSGREGNGDPAYAFGIPTAQFRTDYTVLTPASYRLGYLGITRRAGSTVILDGSPLGPGTAIGDSPWEVVQVEVDGGVHRLESSGSPFGVVVYGFGAYTSYMYPGGLDFRAIGDPI